LRKTKENPNYMPLQTFNLIDENIDLIKNKSKYHLKIHITKVKFFLG
jgi:hypothetical protein